MSLGHPRGQTRRRFLDEALERWNLMLLLLVCGGVIIFRLLTGQGKNDYPLLLGLMVSFVLYQMVENQKVMNAVLGLGLSGQAAYIRLLPGVRDFYIFANAVLQRAESSIDVCYFTPHTPTAYFPDKAVQAYWDSFARVVKTKHDLQVRRIVTADNAEKKQWILNQLQEYSKNNNFSLGILPNPGGTPLLAVMLVDRQSAFILSPQNARNRTFIWIDDETFCKGIQEYFDNLWLIAHIVKDGPCINGEVIAELGGLRV